MNRSTNLFLVVITLSLFVPANVSQGNLDPFVNQITHLSITESSTSEVLPNWVNVSQEPFGLITPEGITNPVLTANEITDVDAEYVADPFLFYENNTWYMFFEVFVRSTGRGEIGIASSLEGFHWSYEQIVLSEGFHLSFPLVLKYNGTYYMIPETHELNEVRIYEATTFPYAWVYNSTIVSGKPFIDPSIFWYNHTWWMFASEAEGYNETYLYFSDNLLTGWVEHPKSPIVCDDTSKARPGGRSFVFNSDHVIRIAQKCDVTYGEQVRVFEVDILTKSNYAEHEIAKSPILRKTLLGWNSHGMHQFDLWWTGDYWLCVADGKNNDIWSIGIYTVGNKQLDIMSIIVFSIGILLFPTILGVGISKIRNRAIRYNR
jgi:hypothetical protein